MAHLTTHRRTLAAPDPETTTMVPTSRKPKPNPSTTTTSAASSAAKNHRYPHPLPDPPSSTIQNISHRFSKLYINHKKLTPHPHPQPEPPNFPQKILPFSDTSCTTLTKSSSQHERNGTMMEKNHFLSSKTKKRDPKKQSFEEFDVKKDPKKPSFEEFDVKKAVKLMPKNEGFQEGQGRNSVSSIPPTISSNGGRRRSFCNSQVELADFLSSSGVKVVAVDMPPFMQIHAVDCARKTHDSLEKFTSRTLAFTLKKEFDGVYGPAWHCIAGTSFGSFVTHSVGGFMYFSMDQKLYILLFKTTVQRAE